MKKSFFILYLALFAEVRLLAAEQKKRAVNESSASSSSLITLVKANPLNIQAIQNALKDPSFSKETNLMEKGTTKTPLHYLVAHPQASKEIVEALITANQEKNREYQIPYSVYRDAIQNGDNSPIDTPQHRPLNSPVIQYIFDTLLQQELSKIKESSAYKKRNYEGRIFIQRKK